MYTRTNRMIIEIKDIKTDAMCVIVAGLREANMKDLAHCFMLWAFEIDPDSWDPVPHINDAGLSLLERILNETCRSYSLRLDDFELTRREIMDLPEEIRRPADSANQDENKENKDDDDEEPDDLPLPEQINAVHDAHAAAARQVAANNARRNKKKRERKAQNQEPVPLTIRKFVTDQQSDIVSLCAECGMPEISAAFSKWPSVVVCNVPRPTGEQIGQLRNVLSELASRFDISVGSVRVQCS